MFNRYCQPLSIAGSFGGVLRQLRDVQLPVCGELIEWFDCEALSRRHELGGASLLVFDYICNLVQSFVERKQLLAESLPGHDYRQRPLSEHLYGVHALLTASLASQPTAGSVHSTLIATRKGAAVCLAETKSMLTIWASGRGISQVVL